MKLHILSDLHNEFSTYQPADVDADVIVLAGDIWKGERGIAWARETWPEKRIIYVAGNHEFYGKNRMHTLSALRITVRECNVDFLDNDVLIIDDTRFLGCTLWTDFELFGEDHRLECMREGQQNLNDFRVIHEGSRHFSPMDSVVLHEESIAWLKAKLNTPFDGQTVVVTHHLPSFQSVADRYQDSKLSACFASRLDHLIDGEKVQLWIHGHTHDNFDYELNGTRVLCNPRGYYTTSHGNENASFNSHLVADVSRNGVELMPALGVIEPAKKVEVKPLPDMSMFNGFDPYVPYNGITPELIEAIRTGNHNFNIVEKKKKP